MKINELMIGDFVTFKDCQKDKVPFGVKIIALGHQDRGEENAALVCIDGAKTFDIIEIDDEIVGIPLTPEILEKNFTSTNNMFGFKNYKIGKEFILENRGERFCLSRIVFGHKYSTFYIIDIFSIHELQHALRLCGIEKEIVI